VNISAADVKTLGMRREQPAKVPGELLAFFVRGKLVNGKNQNQAWQLKAWGRYKRDWRKRVADVLLFAAGWRRDVAPTIPKHVTFRATNFNALDGDGLQLALAPVRDALIACGVISDDRDSAGHTFEYAPTQIKKASALHGVEIRVRLKT
jgi:hypothetical protein